MEEYKLYKNDEFIGTYDIGKLSMKIKVLPSDIKKAWNNNHGIIDNTYRVGMVVNHKIEKGEKYPVCEQMKTTCRFYRNTLCEILTKTNFKYDCPFFKTRKE